MNPWHDRVFNEIIANPTGIYVLVIPRRQGKTTMLRRIFDWNAENGGRGFYIGTSKRTNRNFGRNSCEAPHVVLIDDFDCQTPAVLSNDGVSLIVFTTSNPNYQKPAERITEFRF